jgi:dCMP deaminase
MGLAWTHAAFSKDPSTQVGAVIVSSCNSIIGSGYNGPPQLIDDNSFSWERPSKEEPDALSKYDLIVHAEINAIDHSSSKNLAFATLYVTALPCPKCMLEIIRKKIGRIVYFDFQSSKGSSLQNASWRDKTFEMAKMAGIPMVAFDGNLNWLLDWTQKLKELGVFGVVE